MRITFGLKKYEYQRKKHLEAAKNEQDYTSFLIINDNAFVQPVFKRTGRVEPGKFRYPNNEQ